jgi:hypothetical protein
LKERAPRQFDAWNNPPDKLSGLLDSALVVDAALPHFKRVEDLTVRRTRAR